MAHNDVWSDMMEKAGFIRFFTFQDDFNVNFLNFNTMITYELRHEKISFLHMQNLSRRSAEW